MKLRSLLPVVSGMVMLQAQPYGQTAPPATDIYVASLQSSQTGATIGQPQNISNSPGYDNQPFFEPDGQTLLFTSGRSPASGGPGQMDLYRYDFRTKEVRRVTDTPESEYSPTVMPDGRHISVVRVEADQTQRLWQFTTEGRNPSVLLPDIKPVGYHAWLNDSLVALFVLGQPATLQLANRSTGKAETLVRGIGPSLQKAVEGVSFVQQSGEGAARTMTITLLTLDGDQKPTTTALTAVVPGATNPHHAWMPDGTLLMAHGGSLHAWRRGTMAWRPIADLGALGLSNVTRLAVSPKADRIALVASE